MSHSVVFHGSSFVEVLVDRSQSNKDNEAKEGALVNKREVS